MNLKQIILAIIEKFPFGGFLLEGGRHLIHPFHQMAMWRDFLRTKRECAIFRHQHISIDPQKVVLIVSFSDWIYQVKTEAMLALGLMMKGWHVVVINFRRNLRGQRYFKAFGIRNFVLWEDVHLDEKEKIKCLNESEQFLMEPLTFRAVKGWTYKGAKIGPQIISSVSRSEMRGAPDVNDPKIREQIIQWLPKTLETVHRAKKIIQKLAPKMLFVNESNYAQNGPLVDCAIQAGVNVIQFIQPFRDDAFVFKRLTCLTRRYNPNSVSLETMEHVIHKFRWGPQEESQIMEDLRNRYCGKWFLQKRNQPNVREKRKDEIIQELRLDLQKKTAIVFSHILWDANLFYGEDLFEDYGDWFVQTVRAACANPSVNWIIKMHPANLWKRAREKVESEYSEVMLIRKEIGDLPSHVRLLYPNTNISTWSLFELADYGVTVRGTIGMEMSCFGKPVFTAGTGRYSGFGFTIDSMSKEQYLERLAEIQEYPPMTAEQILLAKKHAYAAFLLRPWPMRSFRAVFNYKKKGTHPLDHNLLLHAYSLDEIKKNGDLEKWAKWAAGEKSVDYLELPGQG